MNNIEELLKQVGKPFTAFNEDGTVQGCMYPIQFLYPDKPRYKLDKEQLLKNFDFAIEQFKYNCSEISPEDLTSGDIILTKIKDEVHTAIYYQNGKIIQVFKNLTLQIGRLKMFKFYRCFRVK